MLNIKNPEADTLARVLAHKTGDTITNVVILALKEKLLRVQGRNVPDDLKDDLLSIGQRCAALPNHDVRQPEDILGYDESGLPN